MYQENPKTAGSGIVCAIPQSTKCKQGCKDCFFQSGRSYLEPLDENLPNMPINTRSHNIIRVNDGNDSSDGYEKWIEDVRSKYNMFFLNTSRIDKLDVIKEPYVLTINPGAMTDNDFHVITPGNNIMFVRIRVNTWNIESVVKPAICYYTERCIPVVLTFMAYTNEEDIPQFSKQFYDSRLRTLNTYYAISRYAWKSIMNLFSDNKWVYSCGNEGNDSHCRFCGNCVREYHATIERMSRS